MTTALRRCASTALGMVAAVAAGCAVGPDFHKPSSPPNPGYTVEPLSNAASSMAGIEHQRFAMGEDIPYAWWEAFGSPEINSLVERAFRANPTVKAAQAALRQAQELVYAQEGYFFPSASADYNVERQKLAGNLSGSTAPGVQGNGTAITPVQSPTPPYNQPLYYNFHTATLTVGFVPDVFGANRRKVESLDAQAQMQRFELEATYISLASNVVAAAIQDASTRAQIKAQKAIIGYNERSWKIMSDKFQQGFATGVDLAVQEQQLAQARALLPPLDKQYEQNRDLLRALEGDLPNEEILETVELGALKVPSLLPVSLPSKIIEQRPDIRAAEQQLRSANAQVGVAVAAMLPQFTITGTAGGAATEFSQMFRSGGPFWTLVGDVSQPIFQGGTLWHTKKAADQALREAAAQYQSTVLQAYQNVADTLHAIRTDGDALDTAVLSERAAKAVLDLTRQRAQNGYSDLLADLAASMTYDQAILTRIQDQATQLGDTAALYQALGGGWWNRGAPSASTAADPAAGAH